VLMARLARRLRDNLGMDEKIALWAGGGWGLALGRLSDADLKGVGNHQRTPSRSTGKKTLPKKKVGITETAVGKALWVFGAIVGIAVGSYSGTNLLFPLMPRETLFVLLLATGLVWWGGKKVLSGSRQTFLPAIAVQAGHLLWLVFA